MYPSKLGGVALVLLALALLVRVEAQDGSKPKYPPAKSPEEAVNNVREAQRTGDLAFLLDQFSEPTRSQMQDAMAGWVMYDVLQAISDKFNMNLTLPNLKRSLQQKIDASILRKEAIGKDKYALTVWVTTEKDKDNKIISEQQWHAVRKENRWKVLIDMKDSATKVMVKKGLDGKDYEVFVSDEAEAVDNESTKEVLQGMEQMKEAAPKLGAMAGQLIKDIKRGLYKNPEEAHYAAEIAFRDFFREHPQLLRANRMPAQRPPQATPVPSPLPATKEQILPEKLPPGIAKYEEKMK